MKNSLLMLAGAVVASFTQFAGAEERGLFSETAYENVERALGTAGTAYEPIDPSVVGGGSFGSDWCGPSAYGHDSCQPLCGNSWGDCDTKWGIDLKVAVNCYWYRGATTGCLIPHYAYLPEYHGYYYYAPYNYKTVLRDQANVGDIGGNPLHPYSTEVFKQVYAENENTDYPGSSLQGVIMPLPRVTPQLPSLQEILDRLKAEKPPETD